MTWLMLERYANVDQGEIDMMRSYEIDLRRRGMTPGTIVRFCTTIRRFRLDIGCRLVEVDAHVIERFFDGRPQISAKPATAICPH